MSAKVKKWWDTIVSDNVKLSGVLVGVIILLVFLVSLFSKDSLFSDDVLGNIRVEMVGMLFDAILLVWIFQWISAKGEKKRRIEHLRNEVEDFVHWNSEEAKFRIRGNLYRLNMEGVTNVKMKYPIANEYLDLSNMSLRDIKLCNAELNNVDFSGCDLANSDFSDVKYASSVKFNYQPNGKGGLIHAKFQNVHIQHFQFQNAYLGFADFSNSILVKVDFSGANLRNANFQGVRFESVNLDGAEVNQDFAQKINDWNIIWWANGKEKSLFDDYQIQERRTPARTGVSEHTEYFLRKINPSPSILGQIRFSR